ncbi:hypothetical protein H702_00250 [Streptococcus equinus JB1]|jgi:hypothetical protein|uniref:Hydrogenase n=2 Tax=Streptococcus equinus TaxID=1335 RepID=A0A091BYR2_STREI|nr:hypothetical protein H702_00250 [Streptococcus equinus JB1]SDQ62186.1 Protein of unknown function [Streptococcus equinus]HHU65618.1 DUF3737 family protein [Streptococcus sp.]SDX06477.1 Protein of unknown function [Streptococcus equinus]SEQ07784.1 Protein of unknown function [Streptococcus equinus]
MVLSRDDKEIDLKTIIKNQTYDEERALYASSDILVDTCQFTGAADGESALKESKNIEVRDSYFNLRYPFWHDKDLVITDSEMTENCRAALWYSDDIRISHSKLHGIKALRECSNVAISDSEIISPEFGWSVKDIAMTDTVVTSEYFMLHSERLHFHQVTLNGKYSFQYITDSVFEDCEFNTKDAFWHAKNVVIKNSIIKGEYLAWYSENVTFENCTIIGTQPFCYCKNLTLINCKMLDADLAFEKSEVTASITTAMISIKNPLSGVITVSNLDELIMDDATAKGKVIIRNQ